jgi:hypothetical protein
MTEILLTQPGTCIYPIAVGLLLLWAICTREKQGHLGEPASASRNDRRSFHPLAERPADRDTPLPSIAKLRASCLADYRAQFDPAINRIALAQSPRCGDQER